MATTVRRSGPRRVRVEHPDAPVRVMPWTELQEVFSRAHKQGEHVATVGQTGSGKSVLMLALGQVIAKRKGRDGRPSRVVVIALKPRDDTVTALGWPTVKKWPPSFGQEACVVWPRPTSASKAAPQQARIIGPLLDTIYREGGQTVIIDEAGTVEDPLPGGLGLSATMRQYWTTARSLKLTLIAGTQRPRNVSRSMWSEPTWLFIFAPDDEDDLMRVAQLSGAKNQVLEIIPELGGHEFLCIHRPRGGTKNLYISKVGTK